MSSAGHNRGGHSGIRKRAPWPSARNRVPVPPGSPGGHADPADPRPSGGGLPGAPPADSPGLAGRPDPGAPSSLVPGAARPPVGGTPAPARSFTDPGPGPSTDPLPAVSAPTPAPPAAPPRKRASFLSRFHIMRLGALAVMAGLVAAGLAAGGTSGASPEPTVEAFLLAWQQGHYRVAARYTDGQPAAVAADLQTAYDQLDAAALYLTMGAIKQSGGTASATFRASVDLGEDGAPWTYTGWFPLHSTRAG